jgi:homoserine dehydrogenase
MNNIGLLGCGTVGRGVKNLIESLPASEEIHLVKVFDRPEKKDELGSLLETDPSLLVLDPAIDTVIECLGGDTLAYPLIKTALEAGKNVITSNKETVARHLKEYLTLASLFHGSFQFEASVGGGIPLLYPLAMIARFDEITSIEGILNGTTDYVLTRMEEGLSFEAAVKEAQEKGFAEKDPTADLEGLDMVRKGIILASLIDHSELDPEKVVHFGISHLTQGILKEIQAEKKALKFITEVKRKDGDVSVTVLPVILSPSHPLSMIHAENNGVVVRAVRNDVLTFIGKGAGRDPTASAILSDLMRVHDHSALRINPNLTPKEVKADLTGTFFVFSAQGGKKVLNDPTSDELSRYPFIAKVL